MATTGRKDYYAILGVPPDADPKTLKRAFQDLARRYHPDRSTEPDAQERFREIAEAYAVLSDPDKRADCDRFGCRIDGVRTSGRRRTGVHMDRDRGESTQARRVVLIGVGNRLRGDDGVAAAVVDVLAADPPEAARLAWCDGDPARLIELWDGADLAVVLDAVSVPPERAGGLHRLRLLGPDAPLTEPGTAGSHGLGVGYAVALAAALGRLPRELVLLGVGGSDFTLGHGLGPAVARAVPHAAAAVRGIVVRHRVG